MTESSITTCAVYIEDCESLMVVAQWQSTGCSNQKSHTIRDHNCRCHKQLHALCTRKLFCNDKINENNMVAVWCKIIRVVSTTTNYPHIWCSPGHFGQTNIVYSILIS